ncbi:unnamed protein product, partial [Mesorhabditis belari]|uniref:CUB domain-containing protein n=1 Tax=Mesorhabditis belari TaxID=2138241 RepID=A0AAF3ERN3_9BILA
MLLFLFFLCQTSFEEETQTFELSAQNPSYAIHGVRLNEFQKITIIGCENCSFLIDYSQRKCDNEPDTALNDNDRIVCLDPFPFSINGEIPKNDHCFNILPYSSKAENYLFICAFEIRNTKTLIVNFGENETFVEFAVSFRVQEWVDESEKTLVIPTAPDLYNENIMLVNKGITAVLVANPKAYRYRNSPGSMILLEISETCEPYEPDIDCDKNTIFAVFAGSSPGRIKDESLHMIDIKRDNLITTQSTVTTLLNSEKCSFCITYQAYTAEYYNEPLSTGFVLTSYGYPWIFDEISESAQCSQNIIANYRYQTVGDIKALEGGTLSLIAYLQSEDGKECLNNQFQHNYSYTEVPATKFEVQAFCLVAIWCPNENITERSGFVMTLFPSNNTIDPKILPCIDGLITLQKDQPMIILQGLNLYEAKGGYRSICLNTICSQQKCSLIIDVSMYCQYETNSTTPGCSQISPFELNGDFPKLNNCTQRNISGTGTVLQKCQLRIETVELYIRTIIEGFDPSFLRSSIAVRLEEEIDDTYDFQLETLNTVTSQLPFQWAFQFEASIKPTWLSLSLPQGQLKILEKFRSDRSVENSYDFDQYQDHCDGTIFLESRGFGNDFEIPLLPIDDNDISYYYFWRQIYCEDFPVDLTIEILSITNGNVSIQFFDDIERKHLVECLSFDVQANNKTLLYRYSNLRGITISWNITGTLFKSEADMKFSQLHQIKVLHEKKFFLCML